MAGWTTKTPPASGDCRALQPSLVEVVYGNKPVVVATTRGKLRREFGIAGQV